MKNKVITMRTPRQAAKLLEFVKTLPRETTLVEVGSYAGASAVIFAKTLKAVVCVDPWLDADNIYELFLERTRPHKHVTHRRKTSLDAAAEFGDATLDAVYIDAAHDYEPVKADILAWRPKLKSGGVLAGHDYGKHAPGVIKAVNELIKGPIRLYGETTWHCC